MKSHLQFVTTPTADTPGTGLVLHFDNKRYLIGNIHEGFQRAAVERQLKIVKVSDIFLSGKTEWRSTGGVMGIILTLADALNSTRSQESADRLKKDQRLTLHGGRNLSYTLATMRSFILRQGMPVEVNEYFGKKLDQLDPSTPTWHDENIKVWAIPITPDRQSTNLIQPGLSPLGKRNFFDYLESEWPEEPKESKSTDSVGDVTTKREGEDEESQKAKLLKGVISDMFDSDWRLDALFEISLSEAPVSSALFIRDQETNKIKEYEGPRPGSTNVETLPLMNVLVRRPWPGQQIRTLPCASPSAASMCYIIRNHPQRGKFLPAKAMKLKVKPGPDFGRLAAGESVISEEGRKVMPEQVLGPGKAGGGFIVADLPNVDYVDSFINRPEWYSNDVTEGVEVIIWILGPEVANNARLQVFISNYKQVEHIISSVDYGANYVAYDASATATIRHCQIDPGRFGIPVHNNRFPQLPAKLSHCTVAKRGLTIQLEPKIEVRRSTDIPPLNTAVVVRETSSKALNLAKAALNETLSEKHQEGVKAQKLPGSEAEIITLGTGSALPSKYRNVSSTLLRVPGSGCYLLDCGENTLGQLTRMYTPEALREIFQNLKMIWISHMHADHHLGLISIIKAWYNEMHGPVDSTLTSIAPQTAKPSDLLNHLNEKKRLAIVSEASIIDFLEEYSEIENFGYEGLVPLRVRSSKEGFPNSTAFHWHECYTSLCDDPKVSPEIVNAMRSSMGLQNLQSAPVEHTRNARGLALTFPGGFKLTFSGDCRPSQGLVEIGMDSTVLVHEATFDDDMMGDAIAKKHSTTSEAIGVGFAMRARRILLTHFSQRYQRIPSMGSNDSPNTNLGIQGSGVEGSSADGSAGPISHSLPSSQIHSGTEDAGLVQYQAFTGSASGTTSSKSLFGMSDALKQTPQVETKVAVAFDFMRVKVKDLASLELFAPALTLLYETNQGRP